MTNNNLLSEGTPVLTTGALLRATNGELFEVSSQLEHLSQKDLFYLLRPLDPERSDVRLTISHEELAEQGNGVAGYSVVKGPDKGPLQQFWKKHFASNVGLLSELLEEYDAPWRRVHTSSSLFQLFDTAQSLSQPLTKEEGLALIFRNFGYFPSSLGDTTAPVSLFMAEKWVEARSSLRINWSKVGAYLKPDFKGQVTDLLRAELAADSVNFCVAEELRWYEARPQHPGPDGKKSYDTARLKALVLLASNGNIFSRLPDSYEKRARINIEGLRMAWVSKYSGTK